jgi:hypothetical protein
MNEAIGRFGSCSPARLRRTASAYSLDGLVLSDDTLVQFVFEVQGACRVRSASFRDGDARPAAHHLGDIVGSDLLRIMALPPCVCGLELNLDVVDIFV